jgi:hypothetical protein
MLDNGCPFIDLNGEKPLYDCESIFLGSISHGLELAVTYYIDSLEKLCYASSSINTNSSLNYSDLSVYDIYIDNPLNYSTDLKKNMRWNVLNSKVLKEACKKFKKKFFFIFILYLIYFFKKKVTDSSLISFRLLIN